MANSSSIGRWVLVPLSLLVLLATLWWGQHYLALSFVMILITLIPFFRKFERKKIAAEEIVMIGMLAAIAAIGRVIFASIPSVQPTSFVIIIAALTFGRETGFMVGSVAAIVSNLFLGQGPWTPWQMFCWGMMGWTAGAGRKSRWLKSRWGLLLFGFAWGFLFGWIMNLWFLLGFMGELSWAVFISAYAASFYFDLAHALSNLFFLCFFYQPWLKILRRVQVKYGLLQEK